ncbi:MAG: RND transporter, partial [Myxococcales bacterium]
AELVGQLDVRQAEQNLASTESTIPQLRIAMIGALNRLAVLLGVVPGALADELGGDAPIPQGEDPVNAGVPADMLRQRPDVRAAERQLAAQTALIGVATADLYPRFTLSGVFAFEGASAQIFQPNGITWGFGPQFRWNIFDGGRIRSTIKVEDARTDQALSTYEQTVLLALEDVENSMVSYQQEKIRRDALHRSVVAARKAVDLVDTLYRTGLVDFQNVLDTQRTQFVEEDRLVQSEGFVTQNLIGIYRALGGGWEPPPSSTTETLAAEDEEAVTASNGS